MAKLWINERQFIEVSKQTLMSEIATRQNRNDFWGFTKFLPNPDPVLKKAGKDIDAYRELLSDAHLGGCVDTRKGNVQDLEWDLDRGKAKSRQAKVIKAAFDRLDLERIIEEILDAPLYGYQPIEILWEERDGYWLPRDIVGKPQEWFTFDPENHLRLRTSASSLEGELVPPDQIFAVQHNARYSNPYGDPVLSRCFWPVVFKKGGMKFWVTFTEKYGMPWVSASYPDGWIGQQGLIDTFFDQVEGMVQDALMVLPQGAKVEVTPTGGTASVDVYDRLVERCDSNISKAIFGHGAAADSTPGKLGNEETARSSVDAKVGKDRKLVQGTMNQILRTITRLNFGESAVAPRFILYEEEDVDQGLATRDAALAATKQITFTRKYWRSAYGFEDDDFDVVGEVKPGDTIPSTPGTPPGVPPLGTPPAGAPTFAEGGTPPSTVTPDQQAIDEMFASLTPEQKQYQLEQMLKPVLAMMNGASDYSEAADKLFATYPDMSTKDLEKILTAGTLLSETIGRLAVDAEGESNE